MKNVLNSIKKNIGLNFIIRLFSPSEIYAYESFFTVVDALAKSQCIDSSHMKFLRIIIKY